jgi:hypothetical protein
MYSSPPENDNTCFKRSMGPYTGCLGGQLIAPNSSKQASKAHKLKPIQKPHIINISNIDKPLIVWQISFWQKWVIFKCHLHRTRHNQKVWKQTKASADYFKWLRLTSKHKEVFGTSAFVPLSKRSSALRRKTANALKSVFSCFSLILFLLLFL